MFPIHPMLVFVILILIIIALSYYFNKKNTMIRALKKIPLKPKNGIKSNSLIKIHGKALHIKQPLIAPLSNRKCVFYDFKIQKRVNSGKNTRWKTIISETKIQDFFVEHNGEYIIIQPKNNPKNYKCYLTIDEKTSSGTFNDPTPKVEKLLENYKIKSTSFFGFNKSLRYLEGVIEIGEHITVAGIAKWKTFSEPIPEYPYSKIINLQSEPHQKLLITDLKEVVSKKI